MKGVGHRESNIGLYIYNTFFYCTYFFRKGYFMAGKKRKSTKAEAEAGARNLAEWKEANPSGGNVRHGAWSQHFAKRYSDKRTSQGRQLEAVIKGLVDDLGGNAVLTSAQRLLLENIRSKLIVIMQISKFTDMQTSLINSDGELLPCLGRNYTTYSESLRRDLEALFSVKRKAGSLNYDQAMKALEVKK